MAVATVATQRTSLPTGGIAMAVLGALTCAACTPSPRTELFVRVRAEPGVVVAATTLTLGVRGAAATSPDTFGPTTTFERSGGALTFPVSLGVVPKDGDSSRRFEVVVTATGTGGARVGEARARGTFVEGRTHLLEIVLEDACIDTRCDATETCRAGACVDATVDVATLPLYDPDAPPSPTDAGADLPTRDAGTEDLGVVDLGPADLGPVDGGAVDAGPMRPPPSIWAVWELPGTPPRAPSYSVSASGGVVLDLVTGLEWQRNGDAATRSQAASASYCDGLVIEGKDDWRLPTRIELATIVDYGRFNPAIDTSTFTPAYNTAHWTRSPVAGAPGTFWLVNFADGAISRGSSGAGYRARCVR